MTGRHSVNELATELNKLLPAYTQSERAAMAIIGSVFQDVIIINRDVYIVVKNGRFYTAYKRRVPKR